MSLRVLVVDDSTIARSVIKRAVAMSCPEATTCYEASDGEQALGVLMSRPIDLVLADVNMPRLTGVGLVARMKQDAGLKAVPILLVSSQRGPEVDALVHGGLAAYLPKPFRPEALREAILALLSGDAAIEGRHSGAGRVCKVSAERLAAIVMEVLEETAFVISRPTMAQPIPYGPEPLVVANLPFQNFAVSRLRMTASRELATGVIASLLDQAPAGIAEDEAYEDALREFVNIVGGRLAAELTLGCSAPVDVGIPTTSIELLADWERDLSTNPLAVTLVTEEGERVDALVE